MSAVSAKEFVGLTGGDNVFWRRSWHGGDRLVRRSRGEGTRTTMELWWGFVDDGGCGGGSVKWSRQGWCRWRDQRRR